ncbi:flagellar motor switch protein FliN [Arthrobacter yangruifuii]|uniref:Flagellar motor switch protein FliN n=1 Tax=Arthrobacter yangruifuii TaxID=2606616 RepID=A0A5N6MF30_9MICC|nr:flagellar motor switch protein FliN [Arthrobacter yangruifuii]KAD3456126.1 flagellar motor switch protein FliN [Arthrobacter yangruifuii]
MSSPHSLHADAVSALVRGLPTPLVLEPIPHNGAGVPASHAATAVTASFVGTESADLALVLDSSTPLADVAGTDSALVSAADVLRPSLEAASATLGVGVLGEARTEDASALFSDPDSVVFELRSPEGTAGWFAIRLRDTPGATGADTDPSIIGKMGRINNIEMALTVEIGHTRMSVRDVLNLEPGRVVELDRSAGAPADILLNGRLIANGEVVVIDQDYAVRITKILDVVEGLN